MSYPYWPNGSVVGYQTLAFNSNTNILTLQPGGNSVNLTTSGGGGSGTDIITSTITINQTASEPPGLQIGSDSIASLYIQGGTNASMSIVGPDATIQVQGSDNGSIYVRTSLVGEDANANLFQVENDPAALTTHTNVVASIDANDNYGAAINLRYISSGVASHQGRFEVYSNETAVSSMVVGLYDADNNPLAELGFSSNGLATGKISAQSFTAENTGVGLGSLFYTGFYNATPLDILQAMPLARCLGANRGEAVCNTGINTFGRMTPGQIYQGIPGTTWSDVGYVVLAPRTYFNVFTGPMGSGGSAQYNNSANDLFSTFIAEPYHTGNTFNSYVLGFGN